MTADHCHDCDQREQENAIAQIERSSLDDCAMVCVQCAGWEEDDVKDLVIKSKAFLMDYVTLRHSEMTKARLPKMPI